MAHKALAFVDFDLGAIVKVLKTLWGDLRKDLCGIDSHGRFQIAYDPGTRAH